MNPTLLYFLGAVLVATGLIIIVITIILISIGGTKKGKISGGGVIMIGPIPIVFGTDKKSLKTVLVLAITLTLVALIFTLVYYWLLR